MNQIEKIIDTSIILKGSITYDSTTAVMGIETVADSYLQRAVTLDSVVLISSFTSCDFVVVTLSGKISRPLNKGFDKTYNSLSEIAQNFIDKKLNDSMLTSISNNDSMCLIIPIVFNGNTIAIEFISGFKIGKETWLSPNDVNTFDLSTLKTLHKWACSVGSQILHRSCQYLGTNSSKINNKWYYFNTTPESNQLHNYLENLYNPCYEYDFVTDEWTCSRYVKNILGINDNYKYNFSGLLSLFARESKKKAYDYFNNILRYPREKIDVELKIIRPIDKEARWITINGETIIGSDEEVIKVFGSISDITLHKETQQQLKATIEDRTRLLSIIGHDLRNPFNAILGFSDILAKVLKEKRYEDAIEYAQIIHESASHGYELLVNILDYSKSETGRLKMVSEQFNLHEIVESIIILVKPMTERKQITITNTIDCDAILIGDSIMISTILRNLVSNAIKFCYNRGFITIDLEPLGNNCNRISVTDTGVEISPDKIDKIKYNKYLESTLGTNDETGTGLGLKLCNSFLALHNSHLEVECANGVTTFSFVL